MHESFLLVVVMRVCVSVLIILQLTGSFRFGVLLQVSACL